ncbi:nucleotide disphospho-sugar-binding domain-containing protein [Micromonospora sp. NPDC050495]|uniref:nucleotide disphospho-sugar-binding domain-containing protein n=1 Tax=Micromonospora sp. NPDC050495 TaxID=3154936 RepID=UPI0033EE27A5
MRVLFIPMAWSSHYYPMVPLAWAFRAAGHDVRVAGQPPVVEPVLRSGLVVAPVGAGYDLMAGVAGLNDRIRQARGRMPASVEGMRALPPEVLRDFRNLQHVPHVAAATAMADELVELVDRWRPELVVTDPVTLVGPVVAAAAGCPLVHHLWGPYMPGLDHFPGLGTDPAEWPAELRALYARLGVPERPRYAAATVDPCPASLQSVDLPDRIPVRYVPYNGSGAVPARLGEPAGRPRVCVSWSMSNTRAVGADGFQVPEIIAALRRLDVEIVVTVKESDRAALGDPGAGVRLLTETPLHLILPGCAAAVHHAGAGTMLTAAACAVPQVMVTPVPDQTFNAERLAATGAGVALKADATTVDDIAAAVSTVLADPGWAGAAARLRAEIAAQPSPAEAVSALTRL